MKVSGRGAARHHFASLAPGATTKQSMKTIATLFVCSLFIAAATLSASSLEDQNKTIAKQAFEEVLSKANFAVVDQFYAKDFVNHGLYRDTNLKEDQALLRGWHQAFSDVTVEPRKLIAEGDLVTIYWVARGRNTGASNGIPATGKKVVSSGITIWRIVGKRIKEEWSAFDQFAMMEQLGLTGSENQ
jgi:steroid delta-isomerase-like uncharacterized protein